MAAEAIPASSSSAIRSPAPFGLEIWNNNLRVLRKLIQHRIGGLTEA